VLAGDEVIDGPYNISSRHFSLGWCPAVRLASRFADPAITN
jgi:hypothetical protein